jgi:hypothetical protein
MPLSTAAGRRANWGEPLVGGVTVNPSLLLLLWAVSSAATVAALALAMWRLRQRRRPSDIDSPPLAPRNQNSDQVADPAAERDAEEA